MKIDIKIQTERGVELEARIDANMASLDQALTTITKNLITLMEQANDRHDLTPRYSGNPPSFDTAV